MTSLGSRMTYWYVLVVTLTVAVMLAAGGWTVRRELVRGIDLLNAAEWQEIQSRLEKAHAPDDRSAYLAAVAEHAQIDAPLYYFQIQAKGVPEFRSENLHDSVLPLELYSPNVETREIAGLGRVRLLSSEFRGLRVQIATSLQQVDHLLDVYLRASLIMTGCVALLSIFIGHRLSRLALDPIHRIQRIATRIRAENLNERIPGTQGKDELAELGRFLNEMFDRLETSFHRLQRFAGDASHELKTPLSIIRLQGENLILKGDLVPAHQDAVAQQLESVGRLQSIIDRMLFLAKAQVGVTRIDRQHVDIQALVCSLAEDAEVLSEETGQLFVVEKNTPGSGWLDPILMRQVLLNLVNNSLQATKPGANVSLSSSVAAESWTVSVADEGIGLPEEKLEEIFEPFVRASSERQSESGAGLGLAICRSVVELHGGKISAENRTPAPGLLVTFSISLKRTGSSTVTPLPSA